MKVEIVYTRAGNCRLLLTPESIADRDVLEGSPDLLPARTTHDSDGRIVDIAYLFSARDDGEEIDDDR